MEERVGEESMKRIGEIRAQLSWIHTYRNLAVSAVNKRNDEWLRENIDKMKDSIEKLEKIAGGTCMKSRDDIFYEIIGYLNGIELPQKEFWRKTLWKTRSDIAAKKVNA